MNIKNINYYEILGIDYGASDVEIRKAYLKLIKQYHPDVYHGEDAEEKTRIINEAYETLINPQKRQEYDKKKINYVDHLNQILSYKHQMVGQSLEIITKISDIIGKMNNGEIDDTETLNLYLKKACEYLEILSKFQTDTSMYSIESISDDLREIIDYLRTYINFAKKYEKINDSVSNEPVSNEPVSNEPVSNEYVFYYYDKKNFNYMDHFHQILSYKRQMIWQSLEIIMKISGIIGKMNNGEIDDTETLNLYLKKACEYLEILSKFQTDTSMYSIESISDDLREIIDYLRTYINFAKKYEKINDSVSNEPVSNEYVSNELVSNGEFILSKLDRIKGMIIKYPENKRIIMLSDYASELVNNYVNTIHSEGVVYSNFDDIIEKMRQVKDECATLVYDDYLNAVEKKIKLQKPEKYVIIPCLIVSLSVIGSTVFLNLTIDDKAISLAVSAACFLFAGYTNRDLIKEAVDMKRHKAENKIKVKKLDRFIDAYKNARVN